MSIFKSKQNNAGIIAMYQRPFSKETKILSLLVDTFDKFQYSDKQSAKELLLIISKRATEMANDEETFNEPVKINISNNTNSINI